LLISDTPRHAFDSFTFSSALRCACAPSLFQRLPLMLSRMISFDVTALRYGFSRYMLMLRR